MRQDHILSRPLFSALALWLLVFGFLSLSVYSQAQAQRERIARETVHGVSLEKTATGESADRAVSVYLPPSYATQTAKRYPVVYLLHGIVDTEETWTKAWTEKNDGYATVQDVMDKGIAAGKFGEMIVVMPNERTKWFGSFYVNSASTGNWEDFTARELVAYIDRKYRTLTRPESRGIAGHSMGGYGALTLAMKHPEVFSVAYGLNPALLGWAADLSLDNPALLRTVQAKTYDELLPGENVFTIGLLTVAQAVSPNPNKPPFYADLPFALSNGKLQPNEPAYSRWQEFFPVNMVARYRDNFKKLRGYRFDSGYEDEFRFIPLNSRAFSATLTGNGIDHIFEEYNGDHRNRLWGRTGRLHTELFPYFWLLLDSQ